MKASVQYNDFIGTAAADINDWIRLDEYLKQKRSYEEFTGLKNAFKPNSCACKKCSEALTKMYSGGAKWTGD